MERLTRSRLKNGLDVLYYDTGSRSESLLIACCFNVGSIDDPQEQAGISHFLEHLMFLGTETKTREEVSSSIENIGGVMNALTFDNGTAYHIRVAKFFEQMAIETLADMILNPALLTTKPYKATTFNSAMEKERAVIINEIRGEEDDAQSFLLNVMLKGLFIHPSYQITPAGTEQTVSAITKENIKAHYSKHYHAGNAFIIIVGNVDRERTHLMLDTTFGEMKKKKQPARLVTEEPPLSTSKEERLARDFGLSQVALAFKAPERRDPDSFAFDVLGAIMDKGLSGRLMEAIRHEEGLAYSVRCWIEASLGHGLFAISASVLPGKANETLSIMQNIIRELESVSREELDVAIMHVLGRRMLRMDDPAHVFMELLYARSLDSIEDLFIFHDEHITNVSINTLISILKKYLKHSYSIIIMPKKTKV